MRKSPVPAGLARALQGVAAAPAPAWNVAGHMVSGAVAYQVLKQDSPEALARAVALLKKHPYYETRWWRLEAPTVPEGQRDLYLFMVAAQWPDEARSNTTHHHGPWHYINLPFKPQGQPDSVQPASPEPDNILRASAENRTKVTGTVSDKPVARCRVLHLRGGVHQSLHCAILFSEDFPGIASASRSAGTPASRTPSGTTCSRTARVPRTPPSARAGATRGFGGWRRRCAPLSTARRASGSSPSIRRCPPGRGNGTRGPRGWLTGKVSGRALPSPGRPGRAPGGRSGRTR